MSTDRCIALFDFDGTITSRDTMFAFVHHCRGTLRTVLGLAWLAPMLVLYRAGVVPNDRAKAILLRHFLGGADRAQLAAWAASFAERIDTCVRPAALERLRWHREQGHEIVVVSASLDLWLTPWMTREGLRHVCTRGRFEAELFTGELDGPNVHGPEKVRRLAELVDLADYGRVYAYGDSAGDREMLELAHDAAYRPFR